MGGAPSSVYVEYPDLCYWKRVFDVLDMSSSDVKELYRIYHCMDVDEVDKANIRELFAWLASKTPFMEKVYSLLDTEKTGQVDFGYFVVLLWNFCALNKNDLISFVFDLYDDSNCGALFVRDLQKMLNDVYGSHKDVNRNAMKLSEKLSMVREICFDLPMFRSFVQSHGALLYPVFMTHKRLRSTIIGNRFWQRMTTHRMRYPSLLSMKKLHQLLVRCQYARENGVYTSTQSDKRQDIRSITAEVRDDATSRRRPAEEEMPTPRLHTIDNAAFYLPQDAAPTTHPVVIKAVRQHSSHADQLTS